MKKVLFYLSLTLSNFIFAQSWSKISSNFDSLWTASVTYFNKGDTIIYYGSTTGTGAFNAKRFYVSLDGGYTFNRDLTQLDAIGYTPIMGLRLNNMILGHKNTPNLGVYSFQTLNNWNSFLPTTTAIFGEVNTGTLFYNLGGGSTTIRTIPSSGGTSSVVASGTSGIDMLCSYNKGNRLFIGGGTSNIKYVDNGDFVNIQSSIITPSISSSTNDVVRFFESASNVYAVINSGFDNLYKSSDNGLTWNLQQTTYTVGSNTYTLNSSFIIGTPNGNIFFLKNGNSDDVYLSTDGGVSATKISNGLPSNGIGIGPLSKLLVNGNKVWYQMKAANNVDFVRTDTSIAGLYLLNNVSTNILDRSIYENQFSIYPNPSSDHITLDLIDEVKKQKVIISNLFGEVVLTKEVTAKRTQFNFLDFAKGVYFFTIDNNGIQSTQKIIIQ